MRPAGPHETRKRYDRKRAQAELQGEGELDELRPNPTSDEG